jgi:YaaC-like Protein
VGDIVQHDWNKLKFLESASNLKAVIKQTTGRTPSTEIARDIAACLQQGRLFFEIAALAPLQVQPLQIYYGIVGFAKAIILARAAQSIATIAQSHGLSDISQQNVQIENLCLQFQTKGVFHQFNDAIAPLGRVNYYDDSNMLQFVRKPFDLAASLNNTSCSLKEILARIPGLQASYQRTFSEDAACLAIGFHHFYSSVQLRIDDPYLFRDKADLQSRVQVLRTRYPWLDGWCLSEATHAWGNSILVFSNLEKSALSEFSDQRLVMANNGFAAPEDIHGQQFIPFGTIVPALAGGLIVTHPTTIQPLHGTSLSEYSLQFCGAFLLSSLVRYRPQLWQHALSHTALENRAADDRALSLIELFLQRVLGDFPAMVEHVIGLE